MKNVNVTIAKNGDYITMKIDHPTEEFETFTGLWDDDFSEEQWKNFDPKRQDIAEIISKEIERHLNEQPLWQDQDNFSHADTLREI